MVAVAVADIDLLRITKQAVVGVVTVQVERTASINVARNIEPTAERADLLPVLPI